jgi:hypothetical protein
MMSPICLYRIMKTESALISFEGIKANIYLKAAFNIFTILNTETQSWVTPE